MSDTCLITGATGFIGGRLTRRLLHEGYAVRCLVRPSSDTSQLEQLDVQIVIGDLTRADSLVSAVEGCQYVVHCGALVSDWATAQEIATINVGGTRNLLEAAVAAGTKRFVHLSSTDVYGYPDNTQTDETYAATGFRNWYAQTKLEAEAEVRRAQAQHALASVILRPATVYGPGSLDVVAEIARAIKGHHMLLIDRGRPVAGLCYVENLLDAIVITLQHEAAPGNAFNVSDGLNITWKQFTDGLADGLDCPGVRFSLPYWLANGIGFSLEHGYRLLRRATGLSLPPLLSRQAVQVLGKSQDFSNRKLRDTLGWEPRVDYASGLQETVAWLKTDHLEA
ncbi:MAG TPA: NAD-dependent epimerase/dehydratase family protein [Solirubrobacteraceae bacterium]